MGKADSFSHCYYNLSGMNKRDNQISNILNFADAVASGKYQTKKEITTAIKCAAGISTAFENLNLLRKSPDKFIWPNWAGTILPIYEIQKEYYRLRKETKEKAKVKAARPQLQSPDLSGITPAPIAPALRQDCAKEPVSLADAIACILAAGGTVVFGDKTKKP